MLPCQEREALKLDSLGIPFPDHLNNEFFPLSYLDLIVLCSLWGCGIAIFIVNISLTRHVMFSKGFKPWISSWHPTSPFPFCPHGFVPLKFSPHYQIPFLVRDRDPSLAIGTSHKTLTAGDFHFTKRNRLFSIIFDYTVKLVMLPHLLLVISIFLREHDCPV
jgi:hypothetical protein